MGIMALISIGTYRLHIYLPSSGLPPDLLDSTCIITGLPHQVNIKGGLQDSECVLSLGTTRQLPEAKLTLPGVR